MGIAGAGTTPKIDGRPLKWTTAEFDALLASGQLREGSKVFLWDGEIVEPMPENEPHVNAQDNLHDALADLLPKTEWAIRPGHPLALRDGYKPHPDLVVLTGPRTDYYGRLPAGADAALVVEIADSTYAEDAGDKLPEYAKAGIPRCWIVPIPGRRVESYSGPVVTSGTGRYESREDFPLEGAIPLVLDRGGVSIAFGVIPVLDILRGSIDGG